VNSAEFNENKSDATTHELARVSILTRIAKAIIEKTDLVHVFKIALQKIRHYSYCDSILILQNNAASKTFYLTPALNLDALALPRELSIYHKQTILGEIITEATTINCPDLSGQTLLPGDQNFFAEAKGSFLAVPILCDDTLLGLLLLTNSEANAFDERDQALVEDVAILLALAMDRTQLQRNAEHYQRAEHRWHRLYTSLLENVSEPIALIDHKANIIFQANATFQELTGYSSEELHGMKLSQLHRSPLPAENVPENVEIVLKSGKTLPLQVRFFLVEDSEQKTILALYQPNENVYRNPAYPALNLLLSRVFQIIQQMPIEENTAKNLDYLLKKIGALYQIKYLTLHLLNGKNEEPGLVFAEKFPLATETVYDRSWKISLSEGPFNRLFESQDILAIENFDTEESYAAWRPVAENLGYKAVIAVPLVVYQKVIGIFSLFYEKPHRFHSQEITEFRNVAILLAQFLEFHQMQKQSNKLNQQIEVISQISNSINSSLELVEVIRFTVTELSRVLRFDHACITLFDESGENIQVFTVISQSLSNRITVEKWEPFGNSELGWFNPNPEAALQDRQALASELTRIENMLQSKMNLLLLSRGKYLGTFSVASLNSHQYQPEQQRFLNQIAVQVATAIENARLFEATKRNLTELAALADVSKSISTSLEIDEVFGQIVKAAAIALKARVCTIRMVQNNQPRLQATSSHPGLQDGKLTSSLEKYLNQTIRELNPVFLDDLRELDAENFMAPLGIPGKMQSLLAVPVVTQGKAIAIMSLYWEVKPTITEREFNLVSMIANQAASAIQNARLYQETLSNTRQLKSANEELENFVYTVSHDLKSPIVSIQGFASILLQDFAVEFNEEVRHFLNRIQFNANQMEKLIRDLLELSRIGRVVNPFEMVDSRQIVLEAQSELIYQLQENKIELRIAADLPQIFGDRNRLVQVFTNLIGNAVKYIGQPPAPLIEVGWQPTENSTQFFVRDNGIGIERQYFEKIFGLFQILNPEEGDEKIGTGVGLTIVKRIVENHGGRIWVESEKGNGATFYFTIPAKESQQDDLT
jgi:PAS domain S-box-containing protein